jgi:hypothetical protein
MYLVSMTREDPDAFLRALVAPLSSARRGEPLPGVAFSREAVANAFVMLGLLPESRAEQILAEHRPALEAKGFRMGVLTGELSVRPGAYGYQDAQAAGQDSLDRIPLAVACGPVPIAIDGLDLTLTWATLTPGGVRLRLRGTGPDYAELSRPPSRRPVRVMPGELVGAAIKAGLSVTDDLGRAYRLRPVRWGGTVTSRQPGPRMYAWRGEMLAEPEPGADEPGGRAAVRWLEFATASGPPARVDLAPPARVATGPAEPPWPTPAECYLAVLGSATSVSMSTGSETVELDTARITAAVADALLWVGALPPDSALLSQVTATGGDAGWREQLKQLWGRQARQRQRDSEPDRSGLAVRLPLRRAAAVIESIAARGDLVSVELYGHPWVTGEYWPMITPCFQVRAVDDLGGEHQGVPGGGGGSGEGSWEFWFWPPVPPAAKQVRVIVSTLWEAAWAEVPIPGRPGLS